MGARKVDIAYETKIKLHHVEFKWKINNFSYLGKEAKYIITRPFADTDDSELKWRLKLYPNRYGVRAAKWVSIFLQPNTDPQTIIRVNFQFTFHTKDNTPIKTSKVITYDFSEDSMCGMSKIIDSDELTSLLVDDVLLIKCWIKWAGDIDHEFCEPNNNKSSNEITASDLLGAMLYEDSSRADVILRSNDGVSFQAHKCVLSARSSVFDAMFKHGMRECHDNCVQIDDVDGTTLENFLKFIYTNNFDEKMCDDKLFIVADKYSVVELKRRCERRLCQRLTIANVFGYLFLADKYGALKLKETSLEFLAKNSRKLAKMDITSQARDARIA